MFGQPVGRGPTEIVEIARLAGQEFAREAEFAVDCRQTAFQFGALRREIRPSIPIVEALFLSAMPL